MLTIRIIPCLDVKDGKVVKGTKFKELRYVGDPVTLAKRYYEQGADELCFLDIAASEENRKTAIGLVRDIAKEIFIPFTVGGGIDSIEDIEMLLKNGADKVSICTQAVCSPELIEKASEKFGSQAIVVSIDVKKIKNMWEVFIYGGKKTTGINAVEFSKKCEVLGAGEILLNSLDRDGTDSGYDIEILKKISQNVNIPVIASSGAGNLKQIFDACTIGKADAILAASIFHNNRYSIGNVKDYLYDKGIEVRL